MSALLLGGSFVTLSPETVQHIRAQIARHEAVTPANREEFARIAPEVESMGGDPGSARVVRSPQPRWIQLRSTGADHLLLNHPEKVVADAPGDPHPWPTGSCHYGACIGLDPLASSLPACSAGAGPDGSHALPATVFPANVGRGGVIDEEALLLRAHWIAGAALDVFATEPLPAASSHGPHPTCGHRPTVSGTRTTTRRSIQAMFLDKTSRLSAPCRLGH